MAENAIGYTRLSGKDQSKESLEYQERNIRFYCERYRLNLINIYTDNGQKSSTFDRVNYRALEAFIRKHRGQIKYLIVMDHDRFSRSLTKALLKIEELEEKFNIKVLSCKEAIDIDTQDPNVFIQRAFDYLMANQELLRIRKRTMEGTIQAHMLGRYVNSAPYGYVKKINPEIGKVMLYPEETKARHVQQIFAYYLAGHQLHVVTKLMKDRGFPNRGHCAITNILKNPLYAGLVYIPRTKYSPEQYKKGIHQPLVSEFDYWTAQEGLGNIRPKKVQPLERFPLRGLLRCKCGQHLTAGYSKGRRQYYLYYRCIRHTNKNYRGEELHDLFERMLGHLSFSDAQIDRIIQQAEQKVNNHIGDVNLLLTAKKRSLAEIRNKIERLEERLMNEVIDEETFKKWMQKYKQDMSLLEEDIKYANMTSENHPLNTLKEVLPMLTNLRGIFQIATLPEKHALVKEVFKGKLTYEEGVFRTAFINPVFESNILKVNEKGLLVVEKPPQIFGGVPPCTAYGSRTRHSSVKGRRLSRLTNAA